MRYKTITKVFGALFAICLWLPVASAGQSAIRRNDSIHMSPKARTRMALRVERKAFDFYTNGLISDEIGDYYRAARSYKVALDLIPESAEISYALANAYFNLKEVELALQVATQVEPVTVDLLGVMAKAYRMLGDGDAYRDTYVRMAKIDKDSYPAFATLTEIYLRMQRLDSAQWALEHLTRIRPADMPTLNRLGRVNLSLKDFEKAGRAFDKSLELDRTLTNLNGLLGRADLYEATDQRDSAIMILKEALDLVGPNPMLLSRIATNLASRNSFAEATSYMNQLVEQVPDDAEQLRRLGMIYYYADSLEQAEPIFDSLIASGDVNDLNHYFKALIYTDWDRFVEAKDQFILAADLSGGQADAWINLAMAYRNLDQADSALVAYQRGLNHVGSAEDSVRLIYAIGATQEEFSQVDEAISSFEWVLAINPEFHPALNYLGYMLADRDLKLDYALELLTKAVEFQPNNSAYLDSFGWVYFKLGDYDKALVYLRQAADISADPVMFDHLGDACSATGDGDEARSWWQKALELDPDNDAIKEKLND